MESKSYFSVSIKVVYMTMIAAVWFLKQWKYCVTLLTASDKFHINVWKTSGSHEIHQQQHSHNIISSFF